MRGGCHRIISLVIEPDKKALNWDTGKRERQKKHSSFCQHGSLNSSAFFAHFVRQQQTFSVFFVRFYISLWWKKKFETRARTEKNSATTTTPVISNTVFMVVPFDWRRIMFCQFTCWLCVVLCSVLFCARAHFSLSLFLSKFNFNYRAFNFFVSSFSLMLPLSLCLSLSPRSFSIHYFIGNRHFKLNSFLLLLCVRSFARWLFCSFFRLRGFNLKIDIASNSEQNCNTNVNRLNFPL